MSLPVSNKRLTEKELQQEIAKETKDFQQFYDWLSQSMPDSFFEDVSQDTITLITHNLMGFHLQGYFSTIHMEHKAIVLCIDSADADLRILQDYAMYGIRNYQCYISSTAPPIKGLHSNIRVAQIFFSDAIEAKETSFSSESKEELRALVKQRNPQLKDEEFDRLIAEINQRFLRSLPLDRLVLALDMFFRAQTRDSCQYEVRYNENWHEEQSASMQIMLAWRNTPKHNYLYRMARIIQRYGLVMKRVFATYINPYTNKNILLMAIELHGSNDEAVWDVADIPDFLRELATIKYFASFDTINEKLIRTEIIPGRMGNFLRSAVNFCHQALMHIDPYFYTIDKIEEDLCRHPELTARICQAFELKFDPDRVNYAEYQNLHAEILKDLKNLDTGHTQNDLRRRNVLQQAINLVDYSYKTNYFRLNYTAVCFRLDPKYLDDVPFDRAHKFPELPYAIFFMKGMHFFGFHIRFKDLSRGGLRTIYPKLPEHIASERDNVFTECYNLAFTQHKKNKDIPEGGSKGIIFLKPWDRLDSESLILRKELEDFQLELHEIELKIANYREEQQTEVLYQAQRSYIESLITLVNCEENGRLRAKYIIDYWKKPEYLYLGPDENMHDSMIMWIAYFSKKYDYKPGSAFISGKPLIGINHKEYGVTSLGLNVYIKKMLHYLGIDPLKESFTIKMSGGPDGDVAGNQICNLHKYFPDTAKLIALTDISGTIYDPEGLSLDFLHTLFFQRQPIRYYPPDALHEGGFLVDRDAKRQTTAFAQQTLCWRLINGKLVEDWLSGSQMNHLWRNNVHQAKADLFIPAGGRPRSLNASNVKGFLDESGKPTAKAIIEGANLYLDDDARQYLEKKGVLIIKDSSANKAGVICSSFEVLSGLTLGDKLFMQHKPQLVDEILERLVQTAANEADLLLNTHHETGEFLTEISERISKRINKFTDQILDYLEKKTLSADPKDPFIQLYLAYTLPILREKFIARLMSEIPENHKKAIIASHIASQLVYCKGLSWFPSVTDILEPILMGKFF